SGSFYPDQAEQSTQVKAALLPLIGITASLGQGIIHTADGPLHVHRIQAMSIMLSEGNLWPRWVPYFHLGLGYPIFNYYPPGVFYLGGLLGLIGIEAATAFILISALAWILGSVGMYALARTFLPGKAALLAVALWAYAPSRIYEVWDQGSLPQMMSAALLPWLLFALMRMSAHPTRRMAALIAVSLAGIVLTHIPIAYISGLYAAPASVIFPLWAVRHTPRAFLKRFLPVAGGLILGGCLAAIFLLPMALELHYVGASTNNDEREYFINYFDTTVLLPTDVFAQPRPFDLTDLKFDLPTTLGLVGGVLSLLGVAGLLKKGKYAIAAILVIALFFTILMLLEVSLDIWLTIPFFRQLRYPERFLRMGSVFVALLGGSSLLLVPKRWENWGLAAALPLVIVASLPLQYGKPGTIRMDHLTALDEIQFEYATRVWGTTSYDEFDPNWGQGIYRPGEVPEPDQYKTDPLRLVAFRLDVMQQFPALNAIESDSSTIHVTTTEPRPVRFHQYYFPGWKATLDGKPVRVYAEDQWGLITIDVPEGEHTIKLHYAGTTIQKIGTAITIGSVGILLLLVFSRHRRTTVNEESPRIGTRAALLIGCAVILFALANRLYLMPKTHWLRHQSPPDHPAYMETPVHQLFGDELELLGYTLNDEDVSPGDWLAVTLFWRPQHPITAQYRPIVQLVNLPLTDAWAVSEPSEPGGGSTLGHTSDRFFSDPHRFKVRDNAPPYVGRLSVQMVNVDTGEPLRLPDGSDRLLLPPLIRIHGTGEPARQRLNIRVGDLAELRCASVERQDDQLVI
ncbi:MAG TPA: 6-pyruvoyl-tetrahydropterin synthase-related protein, partial [Aggregatilineaceae bacterium]|nr:6-pyruvoyl-tetrahydropterin synthase-related protein [Aggregatilineaceae bacterium]